MYGQIIDITLANALENIDNLSDGYSQIDTDMLLRLDEGHYAVIYIQGKEALGKLCGIRNISKERIVILFDTDGPAWMAAQLLQVGFKNIVTYIAEIAPLILELHRVASITDKYSMYCDLLAQKNIYTLAYDTVSKILKLTTSIQDEFGIPDVLYGNDIQSSLTGCIYPGDLFAAKRIGELIQEQCEVPDTCIRLFNKNKELFWYRLSAHYHPADKSYYGICQNIQDVKANDEKIILETVRYNKIKEEIHKIQKLSKVGIWKLYREQMKFSWEEETGEILGFPSNTLFSFEDLLANIHPEDKEYVKLSVAKMAQQQSEEPIEFRLSTYKHPLLFIRMQAARNRSGIHNQSVIEGTLQDITTLKTYSLELEAKNMQLQSINQNMHNHAAEIEAARRKAEESDTLKTSFLSNISHEVRTPISSIGGFAELLRSESISKEQRERYIGMILQSNKQLLQIFTDVLELSKINSNQLKLEKSPLNINFFLREIQDQYHHLVHSKNLQIQLELPNDDNKSVILSDGNKIHRIMTSIMDNAIKFTESGFIRISYSFHAGELAIQVQDSGIGIPEDKLKYVLKPFRQGDETLGRGYGGMGLGLSIVDGLVRLLAGNISITSKIGIGTTVRFTMPVSPIESEEISLVDDSVESDWSDKTVLIIEDNEINLSFFKEILLMTKVNILHAKRVSDSKIILAQSPEISAVVLDYGLPDGNGADLLRYMHAERIYRPTMIVTANNLDSVRQRCCDIIYGDILSKPFTQNDFMGKLKILLYGKK